MQRVLAAELRSKRRDPAHRSSRATLRRLGADNLLRYLGRRRRPTSTLSLGNLGLAAVKDVARRFGSDREAADRRLAEELARTVGLSSLRTLSRDERMMWTQWSPMLLAIPGLAGWSRADKQALVDVVRAKGGRRESEFLQRFDAHPRLGRALLALADRPQE